MFFSKIRKWKRVGDLVLAEVHPLIISAERQTGKKISALSGDNYVLGFITGLSSLIARRVDENLSLEDTGTILFSVVDKIYGKKVINQRRLADLLNKLPQPDSSFIKGFENAAKIYFLLYGNHKLHDDPDYKQALEVVRGDAKHSLSLITPGSTEDSNVASLLLHQYFFTQYLKSSVDIDFDG